MTRLVTKAMTVMTTVTTSWSRESHPRLAQLSHSGTGLLAQLMVCPFTLSGSFPCNFCSCVLEEGIMWLLFWPLFMMILSL